MTKAAVRLLALVVVAGVALLVVLAIPIADNLSGRTYGSHDDVYALCVFVALVGGMAGAVARRPTVRRTVLWSLASWFATIGYEAFVEPHHLFERPYDGVLTMLVILVLVGPIVAACALRADAVVRGPDDSRLAHRLRALFRVMIGIAIVLSVLAFFPGQAEYSDTADCFGAVFAAHGHPSCTPTYTTLEHTRMAGGPFVFLMLALVLAPIQIAYRAPRRRPLWAWIVWIVLGSAAIGVLAFGIWFNLALFSVVKTLWAEHAVLLGLGVLATMFLVVLPLLLAFTREDILPPARIRT
jgi:hypothetical protein